MELIFELEELKIHQKTFKTIATDSENYIAMQFIPKTEEWLTGVNTAYIRIGETSYPMILDSENKCRINTNLLNTAGIIYISCGNVKETERFYSVEISVEIKKSGKPSTIDDTPYTPDLLEQVLDKLAEYENVTIDKEQIKQAVEDYLSENPIDTVTEEEVTQIATDILVAYKNTIPEWTKTPEKPTYTADEIAFTDGKTFQQKYNNGELKGEKGDKGEQGLQGVQGEKGDKGENGQNATITGATATIDNTVGTPTVNVVTGGTELARSFQFNFTGLKGQQGEKGDTGLQGERGQDGYTPVKGTDYFTKEDIQEIISQIPSGGGGKRTVRFVIGTSTAGWTTADYDYLCDGIDDQVEINQAIHALPETGGEIHVLSGIYNITNSIVIDKERVTLSGNGQSTIFKRMWLGSSASDGVITFSKSYCTFRDFEIDGNKSIYAGGSGLYLTEKNTTDIFVQNVFCNNNSSSGIYLGSAQNCTATGNTCNNNSNYGISLSYAQNCTTTGNTYNNNYYGILLTFAQNCTATGNTCNNNSNYGIYLGSAQNCTATGNTCNNNSNYGISLGSAQNCTATGNTCLRGNGTSSDYTTSQYTIYTNGSTKNCVIVGNNCAGKAPTVAGTGNIVENNLS